MKDFFKNKIKLMNFKSCNSLISRSRLENTGEDWSALLLSLRDLNDWVSKKEAELIGLSPIGGDESSLRKQQVRQITFYHFPLRTLSW